MCMMVDNLELSFELFSGLLIFKRDDRLRGFFGGPGGCSTLRSDKLFLFLLLPISLSALQILVLSSNDCNDKITEACNGLVSASPRFC